METHRFTTSKWDKSQNSVAPAARSRSHEVIVYLEIRFPKTADVLRRPLAIELEFLNAQTAIKVPVRFMASRTDEVRGDCYLTYVAQPQLPEGKIVASSLAVVEFEVHQRGSRTQFSREEFFRTSRQALADDKPVLIRRTYACRIQQSLQLDPHGLELHVLGTAELVRESEQQAVCVPESVFRR